MSDLMANRILDKIKEAFYCIGGAIVVTFCGIILCLVVVYYILWTLASFVLSIMLFGVYTFYVLADTILVEIAHFFGKKKD